MFLRNLHIINAAIKSVASSTFLVVKTPDNMGLRCINLNGRKPMVSYFNFKKYICTDECTVHMTHDTYHITRCLARRHSHEGCYDVNSNYCFVYNHPLFIKSTWVCHNTKYVVAINSPICSFYSPIIDGERVRYFHPLNNRNGMFAVTTGLVYKPFSKPLGELLDRLFSLSIPVPENLFVGFDSTNQFIEVSIANFNHPIVEDGCILQLSDQYDILTVADFLRVTNACSTAVEKYKGMSAREAWNEASPGDREWAERKGYLEVFPFVMY